MGMRATALGFRVHTGWAAVVALAGAPDAPEVVLKRRIDLLRERGAGHVFHIAAERPLAEAEAFLRSAEEGFRAAAREGISAIAADLRAAGCDPVASGVVAASGRPLPSLAEILKAHPLLHAAEGELFRRILARESAACGMHAELVPARELEERAARAASMTAARATSTLAALGKATGRPWAQDQREAALAAWIALARR
jgi:hypothetical protein